MTLGKLETIIKKEIHENGPMDIGRFMSLCLGHPKYGYYMTKDPFGEKGDFTTAPEISQMFGEVIGAWVVDTWYKLGAPKKVTLLECGAGRGTLMADMMRLAKSVPEFLDAVEIVILETSPVLKNKQAQILEAYNVTWIENLTELKTDQPMIVLGNELLDALPIRQFQKQEGVIKERVIGISGNGGLSIGLAPDQPLIEFPLDIKEGEVTEIAPVREGFIATICDLLKSNGGAGLFIDYGYNQRHGDTLQAIKDHKFVPVLESVGEADLTAHVDFLALRKVCRDLGVTEYGIVKQADFLKSLGIVSRAQILKQGSSEEQSKKIDADLNRLVGLDQMGKLFKVMAFSSHKLPLAGFHI
ncbi:MAG: class I SAM-dependent methyltransferase [Bdellovibrionales bacterium]